MILAKKGFTLIEILLVVSIAVGIFILSAPWTLSFYHTQLIEDVRSNVIDALQRARHNAILQKNDSPFGVHLDSDSVTIFQGATYLERVEDQDQDIPVISGIIFSGLEDVIFSKLTGLPSATGIITIGHDTISKEILISESGDISKVEVVDNI